MSEIFPRFSSQSLVQSVALLAPEVGEALLPLARRQPLIERCKGLPPLVDGLLEFGLAGDEMAVTVQQRIGQGSAEIDVLQRYLAGSQELSVPPNGAEPLAKLLESWQKPTSPLYDMMLELCLQYLFEETTNDRSSSAIEPGLWIGLSQALISPDERWIAMQVTLDILLEGQWRAWRDALLRTMVACPPEAFVSHVGVIVGRGGPSLRVSVKRLREQTVARYLESVAWSGDIAAATALAERLFHYADHITLCLEVGAEIAPRLCFECNLISQSPTEPRWAALLDDLVSQGLCRAGKRDAFLGWAGMTTPLLTDLDWPDRLIVESLVRPANHLSVLQRRFGFIKVACGLGGELSASGSLRFVPQWLKL